MNLRAAILNQLGESSFEHRVERLDLNHQCSHHTCVILGRAPNWLLMRGVSAMRGHICSTFRGKIATPIRQDNLSAVIGPPLFAKKMHDSITNWRTNYCTPGMIVVHSVTHKSSAVLKYPIFLISILWDLENVRRASSYLSES